MAMLQIDYVHAYKDRHGKPRLYFRRRGFKKVALRGPVGSAEFNEDYAAALQMEPAGKSVGAGLTKPWSISDLIVQYYGCMNFSQLRPSTQENYRRILDRFRKDHGDKMVRGLERKHIHAMMDAKRTTPGAAYSFLKRIKTLFDFAIERGFRTDNPALHVKGPKLKGWRSLTETDIDQYLAHWPAGSVQRRAMVVLVYTGQRRSDAVRMGLQHVRNGRISVTQEKTGTRLWIPIHAKLQAEIDLMPAGQMMFITGLGGNPVVSESFGNMFGDWCEAAGLPHDSSPHGVRKAAGRRLAEAGATAKQIMSILGHKSLSEAEKYCRDAEQIGLADGGMEKLK